MQAELDADYPGLPIQIHAINENGFNTGIASLTNAHTLPVFQDTSTDRIWNEWGAAWRDVMILNGSNSLAHTFNLNTYSLNDTASYDALMQLFVDTANAL